jgi:hypothetical protein
MFGVGCFVTTLLALPFFAENTISGGIYQDVLQNYFSPQTEDLEREPRNLVIFSRMEHLLIF